VIPGVIVIGDDYPFSARNASEGRDHTPAPSATFAWALLDNLTRDSIATGSMSQYDAVNACYESYIAAANTDDLIPGRDYVLRVRMTLGGKTTTRSAILRAMYDDVSQSAS
jgi:hypothetical protein